MNIDFHCHLLPGVDDGCKTLEESLQIVGEMKNRGVEKLVLTPHLYSPKVPTDINRIKDTFEKTREHFNEMGVDVELGAEIFLLEKLSSKPLLPLGDSKYLLIELPDFEPAYLFEELLELQKKDFYIVLAHVERYVYLFKDDFSKRSFFGNKFVQTKLLKLKDMGVFFQVNWNSLIRKEKRAQYLLKNGFLDFISSDKHSLKDGRDIIDFRSKFIESLKVDEPVFGGA
ncbi:hypothetical protein AT15_03515 [Kosmotoga arenicorallina S304]|uniref:protein-tyrosine-phosphatase n=1 Tax=Kosmotoga arenicorallina S304 TaxID=1453497 RepID=A0A176K3L0_9BACT|nr:CpsB/CapC family capsule biosynthesis tyrosine phosphatase [Kosmotoga arenicorallina]OAA31905.1 hypothetical protein AT15_03515 [Kosmotoga arenicorallina S304]